MNTSTTPSAWDLSPVFELIQSLSYTSETTQLTLPFRAVPPGLAPTEGSFRKEEQGERNLGDFAKIWDYLGVQRDVPPPKVATFEASTATLIKENDTYTSDGAIYYPLSSKSVKWRDEEEGLNLTDFQPDSPPSDTFLSKSQRKKRNRKARKAAEAVADATAWTIPRDVATLEKEQTTYEKAIDSDNTENRPINETNQVPLVVKVESNCSSKSEILPLSSSATNNSTLVLTFSKENARTKQSDIMSATHSNRATSLRPAQAGLMNQDRIAHAPTQQLATSNIVESQPHMYRTPQKSIIDSIDRSLQKQRSTANEFATDSLTPVPCTPVSRPPRKDISASMGANISSNTSSARRRYEILPLHFNNSLDRNWSLLLKLMQRFPEDRVHLLSPLQLSINRPNTDGIHVFVDASNIIIGFHDALKRVRGIPQYARVPHVNLNFHALALLLERRRPVAKRVLAGSSPIIPAFEEARQVGYETCILDKVWKAKELTERQRRFAVQASRDSNSYWSGDESGGNSTPGAFLLATSPLPTSSGSPLPQQQPKWVEQAVDEILHLKILESIVDAPTKTLTELRFEDDPQPTSTAYPTMILATGDAAEAEYSSGFRKMVERALDKGWKVEVVAWSKSVSSEYRRMAKSTALGAKFRIIELDDYAEELFGEAV